MTSFYQYLFFLFYCHGKKVRNPVPEYYSIAVLSFIQIVLFSILIKMTLISGFVLIEKEILTKFSYIIIAYFVVSFFFHWKLFIHDSIFNDVIRKFAERKENEITLHTKWAIWICILLLGVAMFLPIKFS